MIMSIAHASVTDASSSNTFGAWSDLVTGDRPGGLLDAYLLRSDEEIRVVAIWESFEAHDQAAADEANPVFDFFEACGLDPKHVVYRVEGRLGSAR